MDERLYQLTWRYEPPKPETQVGRMTFRARNLLEALNKARAEANTLGMVEPGVFEITSATLSANPQQFSTEEK